MIFDVLVPVSPDDMPFYQAMFTRCLNRATAAVDGEGRQHSGTLMRLAVEPEGLRLTLKNSLLRTNPAADWAQKANP